jgi:hypothetical protein
LRDEHDNPACTLTAAVRDALYGHDMSFTEKYIRPAGLILASGHQLKLYHVNSADAEIEDGIQKAAADVLPQLVPEPDGQTPPSGWVVLHRGTGAAYLCAYTWVWDNVVAMRGAVAGVPFLGCEDENPENFTVLGQRWMGCVWELAPFGHERSAWVRHMLTPGRPDLAGYLADVLPAGTTAGPAQAAA